MLIWLFYLIQKDGLNVFDLEKPDIICLQEIKCSSSKMPAEIKDVKGYKSYFNPCTYKII